MNFIYLHSSSFATSEITPDNILYFNCDDDDDDDDNNNNKPINNTMMGQQMIKLEIDMNKKLKVARTNLV